MARIIYSGIVTQIAGSVGGTTFQRNAYGFTIKNKPNMIHPRKKLQIALQQNLIAVLGLWKSLTLADRAVWDSYALAYPQYAKKNITSRLSGHAVFLKRNLVCFLQRSNMTPIPTIEPTVNVTCVPGVVNTGSTLLIYFSPDTIPVDLITNIYITAPLALNQPIRRNMYKALLLTTITTGTVDVTALYLQLYPALPVVGSKIGLILQNFGFNTGAVYASQQYSITVE